MPLPQITHTPLTHHCPSCGHGRTNTGSWFRAIRKYRCASCDITVVVTYDMKLKLHAKLATKAAG